MTYYNTGYIQVEEKDVKALIVAINATEIFGFDLDVTDFYKHDGMAVYDLEVTGDIEDELQEVKKLLSKRLNFRHGYKNPRPHFCNRSTLIIHI